MNAAATAHVTPVHVEAYMADLTNRKVSSVTCLELHLQTLPPRGAICSRPRRTSIGLPKSRRISPWSWSRGQSSDCLAMAEELVEAGLTLITGAKNQTKAKFVRARCIRNGLIIALLALCPSRPKNFCDLGDPATPSER